MSELKVAIGSIFSDRLHPSLLPILSLLSHLKPDSGGPETFTLAPFCELVIHCLSSSHWKVRLMSVNAMTCLTRPENVLFNLRLIVDLLNSTKSLNSLHGLCSALSSLLNAHWNEIKRNEDERYSLQKLLDLVLWIFTSSKPGINHFILFECLHDFYLAGEGKDQMLQQLSIFLLETESNIPFPKYYIEKVFLIVRQYNVAPEETTLKLINIPIIGSSEEMWIQTLPFLHSGLNLDGELENVLVLMEKIIKTRMKFQWVVPALNFLTIMINQDRDGLRCCAIAAQVIETCTKRDCPLSLKLEIVQILIDIRPALTEKKTLEVENVQLLVIVSGFLQDENESVRVKMCDFVSELDFSDNINNGSPKVYLYNLMKFMFANAGCSIVGLRYLQNHLLPKLLSSIPLGLHSTNHRHTLQASNKALFIFV